MPSALFGIKALVSPMLKAVKEQQQQRDRSWIVNHARFARAFETDVTPHREAIAMTLAWWRRAA